MPKQTDQRRKPVKVEIADDAWPRFEQLVKKAAKAGPKPKQAKKVLTEAGPRAKS